MNNTNTQKIITLNDSSDVTEDIQALIRCTDLDVLQINYNCNDSSPSPFTGMKDLTKIKFEIKLGDNVNALYEFFYNCESLKTIPLFDTTNVTNMSYMFSCCESLKTMPLFDTTNVTVMRSMFNGCKALKTIPLFDTKNVEDMRSMFFTCSYLKTVPLFDIKK